MATDPMVEKVISTLKESIPGITADEMIEGLASDEEGEPGIVGAIYDKDEVTKFLEWLTNPARRQSM